jgi:hypothetical protein
MSLIWPIADVWSFVDTSKLTLPEELGKLMSLSKPRSDEESASVTRFPEACLCSPLIKVIASQVEVNMIRRSLCDPVFLKAVGALELSLVDKNATVLANKVIDGLKLWCVGPVSTTKKGVKSILVCTLLFGRMEVPLFVDGTDPSCNLGGDNWHPAWTIQPAGPKAVHNLELYRDFIDVDASFCKDVVDGLFSAELAEQVPKTIKVVMHYFCPGVSLMGQELDRVQLLRPKFDNEGGKRSIAISAAVDYATSCGPAGLLRNIKELYKDDPSKKKVGGKSVVDVTLPNHLLT